MLRPRRTGIFSKAELEVAVTRGGRSRTTWAKCLLAVRLVAGSDRHEMPAAADSPKRG